MDKLKDIQGIIFDYGATIDSNGTHWAEVLWDAYQTANVPVPKSAFRDAYVYGERYLALHPVVTPNFTFYDVLLAKTQLQIEWLIENGFLTKENEDSTKYPLAISNQCYTFAQSTIEKAKPVLKQLSQKYPLVVVSNFYGNIEAVLKDFGLADFFEDIVESAVVGVRKPDPAIFALGVKALALPPEKVVVVGDSHRKDIAPAQSLGCKTIWIKGPAWEEEDSSLSADAIISDFSELKNLFQPD